MVSRMKYTIILGTIIFPAAHTAVIQEIDNTVTVETDTLEEAEEMAEKLAADFGCDWIIPEYFDGEIIDEDTPEDEEDGICQGCGGSGEGMYDGSTCRICNGSGTS